MKCLSNIFNMASVSITVAASSITATVFVRLRMMVFARWFRFEFLSHFMRFTGADLHSRWLHQSGVATVLVAIHVMNPAGFRDAVVWRRNYCGHNVVRMMDTVTVGCWFVTARMTRIGRHIGIMWSNRNVVFVWWIFACNTNYIIIRTYMQWELES